MMDAGSRLVTQILNLLDLDVPFERLKRWGVGVLITVALLFPSAF